MMAATLSRKQREILSLVECQGQDIDVTEVAEAAGISPNTLKVRVKQIRRTLNAPASEAWLEDLPRIAREQGVTLDPCGSVATQELEDDGSIHLDGRRERL